MASESTSGVLALGSEKKCFFLGPSVDYFKNSQKLLRQLQESWVKIELVEVCGDCGLEVIC